MGRIFLFVSLCIIVLGICCADLDDSNKECFVSKHARYPHVNKKCPGDGAVRCRKCKRFFEDE